MTTKKQSRISAFRKQYFDVIFASSVEEIKRYPQPKGDYICKIKFPEVNVFYTVLHFDNKIHIQPGSVFGKWNEILVIEKIK